LTDGHGGILNQLKIFVLGTPVVYWNNEPILIRRRVARSIFYYLAIQGELVGKTELMAVFWPDEEARKARRYLRDILSKLRASLPDPALLWSDIDNVSLDFEHIYVDIQKYNQILTRITKEIWQSPDSEPLTQALYDACATAVGLWRSSRILAGAKLHNTIEFEEWLSEVEKRRIRSRKLLLERLSRHCEILRDYSSAVKWLYDLAVLDPYNEDCHLSIMKMLISGNSPREAILYGKTIRGKFIYELNIQPSNQFIALLDSLSAARNPEEG